MRQVPEKEAKAGLLRAIPSVERQLADPLIVALAGRMPRWIVVDSVRDVLARLRRDISDGSLARQLEPEEIADRVEARARERSRRAVRKVINATGVIIHTNLGRSLLAERAAAAVEEVARSYSSLEFDLDQGRRTSRTEVVDGLVARIVGAEDGFVVNNNAGAVLIALNAISFGRETVVSRGELVEIGGSFRLPDVMDKSGARMVEVGTTNRTRIEDYSAAITGETAAILKVHHSNFAMTGFVESPSLKELADLAHARGLALIEDLGSGALTDLAKYGIPREPMPQESVACGVDVVTFSGDKLLGGPQAGLIAGKRALVGAMKANPLARALRLDKITLAALEETLRIYLEPEDALTEIPTIAMLSASLDDLERRADEVAKSISSAAPGALDVGVARATSQVGGGSMPTVEIPTFVVALASSERSADQMVAALRACEVPVIARIVNDQVCLDLRTVLPGDDALLGAEIVAALSARQ
ncbi:MAG: L-seryl-tRNA(Sec) selenium transferase [bacterium]